MKTQEMVIENDNVKYIKIKPISAIFFLWIAAIVGALICFFVINIGIKSEELKLVTKNSAAVYEEIVSEYSDLLYLRDVVKSEYYLPVDEEMTKLGLYKGLVVSLGDYYSSYLTKEEFEEVMEATSGEFGGIGIVMSPNEEGNVAVVSVLENSPAEKAGVQSGDVIIIVDGENVMGVATDVVASKIKGKEGSNVEVTFIRNSETITLSFVRDIIINQSVNSKMLDNNIGYIMIQGFEENTAEDFKKALEEIEKSSAVGLVIDLRGNSGGLVNSSVDIANMLLDESVVAYTENSKGEKHHYRTKDGKTDLPYVVLIDGSSASSAEILAAGIKDNEGGLLIGTTTYGKGVIQGISELPNGDALKLTVAQYLSPNGSVIDKNGVAPDIEVKFTQEDIGEDGYITNDRQLNRAIEELLK